MSRPKSSVRIAVKVDIRGGAGGDTGVGGNGHSRL
jgi:hypothetical protein